MTQALQPPFRPELELCTSLRVASNSNHVPPTSSSQAIRIVPGRPPVQLSDTAKLTEVLKNDLSTEGLDHIAPKLYLFARHDSTNVESLSRQRLKGRSIFITEEAKLHLVWYYDKIYVMPIPEYLLSHYFWEQILQPTPQNHIQPDDITKLRRAALGFMRSYSYLISRPSDVHIAKEHHILPERVTKNFDTDQILTFMAAFRDIDDDHVSARYTYGQLRLTRVNWGTRLYAKGEHRALYYHRVYWQTSEYVSAYFNTLLFTFASLALVLGALQVMFAAKSYSDESSGWKRFATGSWVFSAIVVGVNVAIWVAAILGIVISLTDQLTFGRRYEKKRNLRRNQAAAATAQQKQTV